MAIVEDGVLASYQIEVAEAGLERGNIYRGVVANIEPSLDAAFIDYGNDKHGFLTGHDIVRQAYHRPAGDSQRRPSAGSTLEKGRSVLVQVTRDAEGSKGATLTTNISFPGRYLVLMPFDDSRGLSRKIEDEAERKLIKEKTKGLSVPDGYGYIVRTSAADQTKTALRADLNALLRLSKRVLDEGTRGKGARLLYDDQDLVVQALRDYLDTSINEVVIDDEKLWQKARSFVDATMPRSKLTLTHYQGRVPLFSRHNIEPQIDSIYKRSVPLEGGASIVIDHTEALTAIDVNSGRNTRGGSQEETAYNTNKVAALEVGRQLQLRDIGGLVVVDFIDMRSTRHRAQVEKALRDALKRDKARSRVGRISANGLLEVNRQRVRKALVQRMHRTCPTCKGVGLLANPELVGLRLLRRVEARAATGRLSKATIALHPELADAVQNQRRRQLAALEADFNITIEVVAATHLHRSDEQIEWTNREGSADSSGAAVDQHDRATSGRSRGRRGGQSRRGGRPLSAVQTAELRAQDEPDDSVDTEEAQQPEGEDASASQPAEAVDDRQEGHNGSEGRSRRRRRRPRRRRRQNGELGNSATDPEGEAVESATTSETAAEEIDAQAGDVAQDAEEAGDSETRSTGSSRRSRRRRGGRRRGGARSPALASVPTEPDAASQAVAGGAAAPADSPADPVTPEGEDTAAGKKRAPARRRRSRSSRSAQREDTQQEAAAEPQGPGEGDRTGSADDSSAAGSEAASAKKATRKASSRRRAPRRVAKPQAPSS